jgi:hypothetical protein
MAMGIGTSLFLIAVGAVLRYAVTANVSWIDLNTVGTVLLVVGVIGLLLSIAWIAAYRDRRRGEVVAEPREPVPPREPYTYR